MAYPLPSPIFFKGSMVATFTFLGRCPPSCKAAVSHSGVISSFSCGTRTPLGDAAASVVAAVAAAAAGSGVASVEVTVVTTPDAAADVTVVVMVGMV